MSETDKKANTVRLGEFLRDERERCGFNSRQDLEAEILRVTGTRLSYQRIGKIERGDSEPKASELFQISAVLHPEDVSGFTNYALTLLFDEEPRMKSEFIYERVWESDGVYSAKSTGEEIVRCRDCRWAYIHDGKTYPKGKRYAGKMYCISWGDGMQGEWTRPDGFCHKAERKDVENGQS